MHLFNYLITQKPTSFILVQNFSDVLHTEDDMKWAAVGSTHLVFMKSCGPWVIKAMLCID